MRILRYGLKPHYRGLLCARPQNCTLLCLGLGILVFKVRCGAVFIRSSVSRRLRLQDFTLGRVDGDHVGNPEAGHISHKYQKLGPGASLAAARFRPIVL